MSDEKIMKVQKFEDLIAWQKGLLPEQSGAARLGNAPYRKHLNVGPVLECRA